MDLNMLIALGGGLGLFIYGMKMLGDGLENAAGNRLKRLLEILTTNRLMGVLVGAVVAAIIQSSSATTVMLVGFVNAGIMSLAQTVGVIMGANIGTTITAQLIAFNLTDIAPLAVFIGVGLIFFAKKTFWKKIGEIIAGFGILFIGIGMMSAAMAPLRDEPAFRNFLVGFKNPVWGVLAGCIFTAIIQSSSASVGILQALAMQGLIGLDGAIYVLFGQNIGTCITVILASIGTNVNAKRTAFIHLLFNVIGTVIFMAAVQLGVPYVEWIESLSPGDTMRQIANAHTGFNIVNTLILLPLGSYLVKFAEKAIPGGEIGYDEKRLMYVDKRILETPPIAVAQIMKEVQRMADLSKSNAHTAMEAIMKKDENLIDDVYRKEDIINYLNSEITNYLVLCNGLDLPSRDLKLVGGLFHVVNDIERIGDHAENLVEYAEYFIENNLEFSDIAVEDLEQATEKVMALLDNSIAVLNTGDKNLAKQVEKQEEETDELLELLRERHIDRLNNQTCNPSAGVVFLDIITNLERIADHGINISQYVLES